MDDSEAGAEKVQDEPGVSSYSARKEESAQKG